jgi:CBS domain-containing protein
MRLKDLMSTKVKVVAAKETLENARSLLRLHRIHHLIVVDGITVVGVVTDELLQWGTAEGIARVEDVMVRHVASGAPEMTVRQAANMMRRSAVGALPVVDRDHHLAGIVTVSDLLDLIGRGGDRPVQKGKRWTLRHRGERPRATVTGPRSK